MISQTYHTCHILDLLKQTTLAAASLLPRAGQVWYYMLTHPVPVLLRHREGHGFCTHRPQATLALETNANRNQAQACRQHSCSCCWKRQQLHQLCKEYTIGKTKSGHACPTGSMMLLAVLLDLDNVFLGVVSFIGHC